MPNSKTSRSTTIPGSLQEHHKLLFDQLIEGDFQAALVACIVDGVESSCIAAVGRDEEGNYTMCPLFVAVTESMHLLGPDGDDLQESIRDKPTLN